MQTERFCGCILRYNEEKHSEYINSKTKIENACNYVSNIVKNSAYKGMPLYNKINLFDNIYAYMMVDKNNLLFGFYDSDCKKVFQIIDEEQIRNIPENLFMHLAYRMQTTIESNIANGFIPELLSLKKAICEMLGQNPELWNKTDNIYDLSN